MRGLFVSTHFPANPKTDVFGVFKRQDLFLEALLKACSEVDALFYVSDAMALTPEFRQACAEAFAAKFGRALNVILCPRISTRIRRSRRDYYAGPIFDALKLPSYAIAAGETQVAAFEACLDRNPDLIFIHRLYGASPLIRSTRRPTVPVLMDLDEVEHRWFYRHIGEPPHWRLKKLFYLHIPALALHEVRTIGRMQQTYVASPRDQRYLAKLGCKGVATVSNVVASPAVVPPPSREPVMLFMGSFRYQPNVTAARRLVENIWPTVHAAVPEARLVLAGEAPERIGLQNVPPSVELPGFVEDLQALYARTQVVCCPIFTGGGTRLKLIEAAAFGRAIVSTPIGAEGIDFKNDVSAILSHTNDEIARASIDLLRNPEKAARLGDAARAMFVLNYDRQAIVNELSASFRDAVRPRRAALCAAST